MEGYTHKAVSGRSFIPVCGGRTPTLEELTQPVPETESFTMYWDQVTCPKCLEFKPLTQDGRTSIKRSHRAEGQNWID